MKEFLLNQQIDKVDIFKQLLLQPVLVLALVEHMQKLGKLQHLEILVRFLQQKHLYWQVLAACKEQEPSGKDGNENN